MTYTKEKIIETAFVLLLKNGYNGVSIGTITGELNIARSLPYRYFKSKRDLLFEACKQFYYERYFPESFDFEKAGLSDIINIVSRNLMFVLTVFGKSSDAEISVFDYNAMYLDMLRHEPRFKKYMRLKILKMREVIERAAQKGELKENVSVGFVERGFLDIWSRCANVQESLTNRENIECIMADINMFYSLVKR
jgi:transcriptional regulator, TetR family